MTGRDWRPFRPRSRTEIRHRKYGGTNQGTVDPGSSQENSDVRPAEAISATRGGPSNSNGEHIPVTKDVELIGYQGQCDRLTKFDRAQQNTDNTIKWFTVVSGVSAAISAGVAFYVASQIVGSSRQTDAAIQRIADLAVQTKRQADLVADANGENQSIANQVNIRSDHAIRIAEKNATAAVKGVHHQDEHFKLDERPILALSDLPTNIPGDLQYDAKQNAVGWNYGVRNFGKTTAINIKMIEYMSVMGKPFKNSNGNGKYRVETDLVPTQFFWSSVRYNDPFPNIVAGTTLSRAQIGAIMLISLRYTDLSGSPYREDICLSLNYNGTVGNCQFDEVGRNLGFEVGAKPAFEQELR